MPDNNPTPAQPTLAQPTLAQPTLAHPAVSPRQLLLALAVTAGLLLLAYLVAFDQGAVSQTGTLVHEVMHDGRHLLGVPCH